LILFEAKSLKTDFKSWSLCCLFLG